MIIRLPLRTVSEANVREHWAKKSRRARELRTATSMALEAPLSEFRYLLAGGGPQSAKPLPTATEPLQVHLERLAPRLLDDDNLRGALKAIRDGVADSLRINDRDPRVTWQYSQSKAAKVRQYEVAIEVTYGRT